MSTGRRHALSLSPAVKPPLEDDDLLSEILLRLPPQPSSLPRASLVSKRWRQLVSDPRFFRLHHRRNPPLLGCFQHCLTRLPFLSTLEAPNRVPPERFAWQRDDDDDNHILSVLGCRHGLLLFYIRKRLQILVWDPVTGDQHRIAMPVAFNRPSYPFNGAVLGAAGDDQHFQVVLVLAHDDENQHQQALACVYSSKALAWGNLISTRLSCKVHEGRLATRVLGDAVLAGGCLYWELSIEMATPPRFDLVGILEFDLERQSLAVIRVPVDVDVDVYRNRYSSMVIRAEGGGLGFLFVSWSDYTTQLWKRTTDCDGVASWGLARTIELGKLLPLKQEEKGTPEVILGFAEENNMVFLHTMIGITMIHLESLKFKKLDTIGSHRYHPFESVYTAGARVADVHDGGELLPST